MNCKECKQRMEAYLDGELNKQETSAFEQHLTSCETCRMEVKSVDKCISLMRTVMEDVNPPNTIRKGILEKLGCCDMASVCCVLPKDKQ